MDQRVVDTSKTGVGAVNGLGGGVLPVSLDTDTPHPHEEFGSRERFHYQLEGTPRPVNGLYPDVVGSFPEANLGSQVRNT